MHGSLRWGAFLATVAFSSAFVTESQLHIGSNLGASNCSLAQHLTSPPAANNLAERLAQELGFGRLPRTAVLSEAVPVNASVGDVLAAAAAAVETNPALLVVVPGPAAPLRRAAEDPWLRVGSRQLPALAQRFSGLLAVGSVNAAVRALESATGLALYPLSLELIDFKEVATLDNEKQQQQQQEMQQESTQDDKEEQQHHHQQQQQKGIGALGEVQQQGGAPSTPSPSSSAYLLLLQQRGVASVYDVSGGVVLLDAGVARGALEWAGVMDAAPRRFAEAMLGQLRLQRQEGGSSTSDTIASIAASVSSAAAAAVGAAVVHGVPLWFCIACPILLGLLAPLLLNAGLGAVANALCERMSLPSDQCNELWYGAFALAMVLSFASAIPIVYICRLPECAKRPHPPPAA